jgi:cytochrome P450
MSFEPSREGVADAGFSPPLHEPAFHAGDPFPAYRRLRESPTLHWSPTPGFWAVTRHDDVVAVSRDPSTFCSSKGTLLSDLERPIMPRQSIIYMDPPEHGKYRKLVQPAFSPGRLRALEIWIRDLTRTILDGFVAGRPVELVETLSAQLPILVIAEMLGVPASDQEQFKQWSDAAIEAASDPSHESMVKASELLQYFAGVLAERRVKPGPDILSTLVSCEIDGERLDEFDLLMFCMTLLVAGNETTRNLISQGALALAENPDQMAQLVADPTLVARSIEEMLRYGSPILAFMRTALRDTEVRGTQIREGDRLLMLYASANRDEEVFGADADRFRVTRDASGHVAFGFGEHFCLGAALARMEGRIAFEEIVKRWSRIELAGPVETLPSLLVRGIVRLPVVFDA